MRIGRRIVNALRRESSAQRPSLGQLLSRRPEDQVRDYPADGLTPSRMGSILREADGGNLDAPMQLYEQMEEKDAHLFSVASTRRLALTGLDWEVTATGNQETETDDRLARETASYCREALGKADGFDEALQHLALAIGRNISVVEMVWEEDQGEVRLCGLVPVAFTRLVFDDLGSLRILTKEEPRDGIAVPDNKFVIHTPHSTSGHPSRGGLLRATALAFLGKQYAIKDWMVYAEVFGMPTRVGRYDPKATTAEKRELLEMLRNLGTEAAGVFSKSVSLEFLDANRGTPPPPYEAMTHFFNREISKAWLGQTLTTDASGSPGSFSVAKIHEQVRQDIREDDQRKEAQVIRRDVLGPLTRIKFGHDAPVPVFRRKKRRPSDATGFARMLSVAVNDLGMEVPSDWAGRALGLPVSRVGDAPLRGRAGAKGTHKQRAAEENGAMVNGRPNDV